MSTVNYYRGEDALRANLLASVSHGAMLTWYMFALRRAQEWRQAAASKSAFERYIRDLRRRDIGEDADGLTEADFLLDLAEPGWPDSGKWCAVWVRIKDEGELTPREREQALAYWHAGEELPAKDYRFEHNGAEG